MDNPTNIQELEPKRLPLVVTPSNRDTSAAKDARLVNCFVEKDEYGQYWIFKRPGLAANTTLAGGAGRGVYNWRGNIYAVSGTTLYRDGVSLGTVDGTNGLYKFDSVLGTTPKLVLGNGVKAYYWDATNLVEITDAQFPAAFVKGWAYLNGTLYVMVATANIQGSDTNDPSAWDALNTILAQVEPDRGIALAKQLSYAIALKEWTTEVFYDEGNATGSPLAAMQGAKVSTGCAHAESVQNIDDILMWLGASKNGSNNVMLMDKLKASVVSSKPIERLLDDATLSSGVLSWFHKDEGHTFYGLTCKSLNLTLVYDLREQMWSQWTDANGDYLPIVASTTTSAHGHLVQLEDGNLYTLDASTTVDAYPSANSLITVDIYTPNTDFGNRWNKYMKRLDFIADQTPGSVLQIRVSDDDYKSWSHFRKADLNQKRPSLRDWGTFRRRAHNLRHACPTRFRIQAVEYDLLQGAM